MTNLKLKHMILFSGENDAKTLGTWCVKPECNYGNDPKISDR